MSARQQRAAAVSAQAYDRFAAGETQEVYAPWENPELNEALDQMGQDRASTGFGRRLMGGEGRAWDPSVPYPQIEPSNTSDEERPRTIAMGYDPGNEIVRVTFRPDASGHSAIYEYTGVPQHVWDEFSTNYSPGRFIDDFLDGYSYSRKYELEGGI